jgi:hypothetical protein
VFFLIHSDGGARIELGAVAGVFCEDDECAKGDAGSSVAFGNQGLRGRALGIDSHGLIAAVVSKSAADACEVRFRLERLSWRNG